ncbi:MAG: protein kinase [Myxococcota bacterium]|nr:protein kinase [Myxococcota bacterium]
MEKLGRYTTIRKIGTGGMAEVFLARSEWALGTEKHLVIKKIHPFLAENERFIEMFVDEAKVAMRLNHANIVQVYTFEQIKADYVLAMEYVDGFDLLALETAARQRGLRMPSGLAAFITAEVAKGLDYAHSRWDDRGQPLDIVHRDVSPQNILISRGGEVKVTDFGIAKARSLHEETIGTVKGKYGYMAPEQARGRIVDRRADVYSLGVVLHEMLVGKPYLTFPPGADPIAVISKRPPVKPSEIETDLPQSLDTIVQRAMASDPANRFQTGREMAQSLIRFLHAAPEIYDAHALERWVEDIAPAETTPLPGEERPASTVVFTDTANTTAFDSEPTAISYPLSQEEQRFSTVVCGRLDCETHPNTPEMLEEALQLMSEMAYKADGILQHTTSEFTIFLGILHFSSEDAISGIRLAHDILDAVKAIARDRHIHIQARVGITRILVSVGEDPNGDRISLDPSPDLDKSAERLVRIAKKDAVAVDESIRRLAKRDYHFEPSGPLPPEGTDASSPPTDSGVAAYFVVRAKSRLERSLETRHNTSFYNREEELKLLETSLHSVIKGERVLLKIQGETGIGKSRLVSHFLKTVPQGSIQTLTTECLFAERDRPLAGAIDAIRILLNLSKQASTQALIRHLSRQVGKAPRYYERHTHFLRQLAASPDTFWTGYAGGRRELIRRTAECLGGLISLIARSKPLVAVIENAHWIDGPSVDVLSELINSDVILPVLLILVGQLGTAPDRYAAKFKTVTLSGLPEAQVKEMVIERLGTSESMLALADQVTSRALGNPYFTNEIIDSLEEQGIIVKDVRGPHPAYRQARQGTIRLPTTLAGIALSRLDGLPSEQRSVIRTAAAVGASFTAETVGQLIARDVTGEVTALVEQGLFAPMPREPGRAQSFRFNHPMIREAAYEGLSRRDRHRIHRSVANQLIAARERKEAVPNVRIAWHMDRAGETDRAGQYYLAAGNAAMDVYSNREALRLYDRALKRLPKTSLDRFEALSKRDRVLRDLWRYKDREQDLAEMEHIARTLKDNTLIAHAITRQAQLAFDRGDCTAAARHLSRSLERAVATGDVTQQVEALRLLAYVAVEEGHLVRALDCCNRALALIGDNNGASVYLKGRALGIKGFVSLNMGHLDASAAPLAEALILFRRLGKRRNESLVMGNLSLLAQARGEMTEAIEFLQSAIRIDAEVRDLRGRGRKLVALGGIHLEIGNFIEAEKYFRDAREICRDHDEKAGEIGADLGLAELGLETGEHESAQRILEDVGQRELLRRHRLLLVRHRQLIAGALVRAKSFKVARRLAEEATRIALEAGMIGETVRSGVRQGLILAQTGRMGEALVATRRATDLLANLGRIRRAEQIWWYHALTLHKAGNHRRAENALDTAREEVQKKRQQMADARLIAFYNNHPLVKSIEAGLE